MICFSSRLQNLKLRITCAYVCNTFSGKPTKQTCKKCSICSVGQRELTPCNLTHDRICGRCEKGFYGSKETGCKPCSACCSDKDDVRIPECQNMAKTKQCSYTERSITVCQEQNSNKRIPSEKSPIIIIFSTLATVLAVISTLVIIMYIIYRRNNRRQRTDLYNALLPSTDEGKVLIITSR